MLISSRQKQLAGARESVGILREVESGKKAVFGEQVEENEISTGSVSENGNGSKESGSESMTSSRSGRANESKANEI